VHLYGCLWCFLYSPCVVISNLDHPCKTIYNPKHCTMAIFSDFYSSSTINNWLYAELQSISSVYLFRSLHLYRFSPCLQNAKRARWKILLWDHSELQMIVNIYLIDIHLTWLISILFNSSSSFKAYQNNRLVPLFL
jgi:hypothetical protein